jgi:hypothetical protein
MSRTITEEVGRMPGLPDTKVEMAYKEGPFGIRIPYPRVYTRDVTHILTVSIQIPDEGDFTEAIKTSLVAGLASAGIAAWLATPGAAIPAFKAAFFGALAAHVGERISEFEWVGTGERQERGEWSPV